MDIKIEKLSYHKRMVKMMKKKVPDLPLMRVQHFYALLNGFKSWADLRDNSINDERK